MGASGVWHGAVAGGPALEADAQVRPQHAAEEVAGSEISADGQATQPVVTTVMVIWRLTWTVRWKILFQMVLKNISPHLTPS